jgi:glycerol kinase
LYNYHMKHILAIDQGTTSSRAILFDEQARVVANAQHTFKQYFPKPGWVEHDPEEIWQTVFQSCQEVLAKQADNIAGIGVTNQRETTVIWDRQSGKAIYPAIVWQDSRTSEFCALLKTHEQTVQQKTGLLLDPYFSASKIHWILQQVEGARAKAENGELAFGTVDSFLLWRLTGGRAHATDVTNASRTLLFNIQEQCWDEELLTLFNIPKALLPEVKDNCADFGVTDKKLFNVEIPISAMAGDQQAASFGQCDFEAGSMKSTYGTGCFMLLNTGSKVVKSTHRLLSTIAYRVNGKTSYALEGSIFMAGAIMQWLRDELGLIKTAAESGELAATIDSTNGVYLVPAFTGLGAPHWQPDARAAFVGMTRDTSRAHLVRASLEAVAYRTLDVLLAMRDEGVELPTAIRVDGGMSADDWFLQFLADMLQIKIQRAACLETTDLGVAFMAGLQQGVFTDLDSLRRLSQVEQEFLPKTSINQRDAIYSGWQKALQRILD